PARPGRQRDGPGGRLARGAVVEPDVAVADEDAQGPDGRGQADVGGVDQRRDGQAAGVLDGEHGRRWVVQVDHQAQGRGAGARQRPRRRGVDIDELFQEPGVEVVVQVEAQVEVRRAAERLREVDLEHAFVEADGGPGPQRLVDAPDGLADGLRRVG